MAASFRGGKAANVSCSINTLNAYDRPHMWSRGPLHHRAREPDEGFGLHEPTPSDLLDDPEALGKDSSIVLDLNDFDEVFSKTTKRARLFTVAAFDLDIVVDRHH